MGTLNELEAIYRAEYRPLVASLTLLAGSREAAADAVQDAFVAAGVRWKDVAAMDRPAGWIRTVAVRTLLDGHRRSRRWRRAAPKLVDDEAGHDRVGDPDLLAALQRLPEKQRAAVVLHYLADWPIADVAAALDSAPGTVKSNLSDARATLRAHLSKGTL